MAPRRRSSFPRSGGQRRKSSWSVGPDNQNGTALTGNAVNIWAISSQPTVSGLTLVRTRGEFLIFLETATAAGDGYVGAVGIGVATTAAVAVGVTAVPTPITEEDWDGWLWHSYFHVVAPSALTAAGTSKEVSGIAGGSALVRIPIDSKAMRKLEDSDFSVFGAVEVAEIGTATMRYYAATRLLVKLP